MMERFALQYIQKWMAKKRRKPLILRGARQTGKSTLVRLFAQRQTLKLNEVNLEKHLYLNEVFQSLDINRIINELEAITGSNLKHKGSILFLDEIQATPHALQALRYFYEETPDICIIAAGSLLEFTLSDHSFPMPVGRIEYYHLGPMTFKEFLGEIRPDLLKYIAAYNFPDKIPDAAHKQLNENLRVYFFTGGMPEAVLAYKETGSVTDVTDVHRSISDTYLDDFSKYGRHIDLILMQQVFRYIPRTLGTKIKYSNVAREKKSRDVKRIIDLLVNARVCHKVYHSHSDGVPLFARINENIYKLIFMDIGIVNHICGNDFRTIQSLLTHKVINEGGLAEQFIGQHLILLKNEAPTLFYWVRQGKSSNAEVDYVISNHNKVYPVEVKSGKSGSLKSLQQFVLAENNSIAIRFDLNPPSIQDVSHIAPVSGENRHAEYKLISLPLYMAEELLRTLDSLKS